MLKLLKGAMSQKDFVDMITEKALEEIIKKFGIDKRSVKSTKLKKKLRSVAEELYNLI